MLCVQPGDSDGLHETASLHRIAARDRKFYGIENRRRTRASYSRTSVKRALILPEIFFEQTVVIPLGDVSSKGLTCARSRKLIEEFDRINILCD